MKTLSHLIKNTPNDAELGKQIRKQFTDVGDPVELLKEVLALHGYPNFGQDNALVERGQLFRESPEVYVNYYNSLMIQRLDDKILDFFKRLDHQDI